MGLANRKGGPLFPRVVSSREKIRHNCIFGTCNQESQDTEATAFVFVVICRLWVCLGLHGEQGQRVLLFPPLDPGWGLGLGLPC